MYNQIITIFFTFLLLTIKAQGEFQPFFSRVMEAQPNIQQNKWKQANSLITFEQTIEAFPFIRQNMKHQKILKLLSSGGCNRNFVGFLILDNELYYSQEYEGSERKEILVNFFKQIIQQVQIQDMYFLVHIEDELHAKIVNWSNRKICRQLPIFMMNKNCSSPLQQTKFLLPDPFIISGNQIIKEIKEENLKEKWENKTSKAFFRGISSGPYFYDITSFNSKTNFNRYFHRAGFIILSFQHPDLIDARFTDQKNQSKLYDQITRRIKSNQFVAKPVPFIQFLKYKYLLTADGFGASWGKIPFILFSNSILLKPFSQKIQWFYDKMIPNIHFISIKQDLSDLIMKIEQLIKDDEKGKRVSQEANKLAEKYLIREQIKKYTIQTLKKYAKIQQLNLSQQHRINIKNGTQIHKVFGLRIKKTPIIIYLIPIFILVGVILLWRLMKNKSDIRIKSNDQVDEKIKFSQNSLSNKEESNQIEENS